MEKGRNEQSLAPFFGGGGEVGHFADVGIGGGFAFGDVRGGDGGAGLFAEPFVEFALAYADGRKRGGGALFFGHWKRLLGRPAQFSRFRKNIGKVFFRDYSPILLKASVSNFIVW